MTPLCIDITRYIFGLLCIPSLRPSFISIASPLLKSLFSAYSSSDISFLFGGYTILCTFSYHMVYFYGKIFTGEAIFILSIYIIRFLFIMSYYVATFRSVSRKYFCKYAKDRGLKADNHIALCGEQDGSPNLVVHRKVSVWP